MKGAIDMTYVVKKKFDRCQLVCTIAVRVLYALSVFFLARGLFRPFFLADITAWSVWLSMLLEASAYGLFKAARWVERNAL